MAQMAENTAKGARFMTYPVTFSITCPTESSSFTTGSPLGPMAAVATPKNRANTTICKISLWAIASITLEGNTCVTKCSSVMAVALTPVSAFSAGTGRCMAMPGLNRFTSTMPSNSETRVALMNQAMVLAPMRPTAPTSPSLATPTTSVESTSGAMIILMRLRNTVVMMDTFLEMEASCSSEKP